MEYRRYANANVKVLANEARIQEVRLGQRAAQGKTRDTCQRDGAGFGKGAWRG